MPVSTDGRCRVRVYYRGMSSKCCRAAAAAFSLLGVLPAQKDPDTDGDGLSDFMEVHKYLTDPKRADSDGDGVPDGDWRERREYQYTVRTVVQVMRPVTIEYLCDDYQDARVLDETREYVELEVIHYPFNTVASAIKAQADWRKPAAAMKEWLQPGPTSDWTPELRQAIETGLQQDGIDAAKLDDKTLLERAAKWLLDRARHHHGFTTFVTAFDAKGQPYMPEAFLKAAPPDQKRLPLEQQWPRELSARGMFEHKTRGSCSSSAIYLSGCLRALGVPTRTVLVIPVIDANDDAEVKLAEKLQSHQLRREILTAARERKGQWASHTFNEVWVGGRWRRLNYDKLGQDSHDRSLFGLMTHVATFRDWADAKMPETIGRRQKLNLTDDVFGGANPYSTIALRDEFGVHCKRANPVPATLEARVTALHWSDDATLPEDVRDWLVRNDAFGLIARVDGMAGNAGLREFMAEADGRVLLKAEGQQTLGIGFHPGCSWWQGDRVLVYVPFGKGDQRDLVAGVSYQFVPRNDAKGAVWRVADDLRAVRNPAR